jgi:catechol 2,3-dioxygenase-like lactoylglutathione lyase family enzyme
MSFPPSPSQRPNILEQITFFYYKDLDQAAHFYADILGLELVIDQGFAKVFRVAESAYLGVVDETKGAHRASETKPVELTLVVSDPDAWYAYLKTRGVETINEPHDVEDPHIRCFLLHDPEGYLIEIQKFL